ncbi:serine protease [Amycolatopsis sp. CB00013]|nr:serine protease [Amycolatopsis sp. CB00013]
MLASTVALLLAPALVGTSATSAEEIQPNIVGGSEAKGNTSWMASLQYDAPAYDRYARHTCGGALVFRSWVVTGAHCVTDMPGDPNAVPTAAKTFFVRVGSKDRTGGGETAKVTQIVIRPGWQWGEGAPQKQVDDLAMLKLDHPVDLQPIQLSPQAAHPGERVRLYGWGSDDPAVPPTDLPRRLQQLDTTVLAPEKCAGAFQSAGEICTDNPNGTDGPGHGDSGGPAVRISGGVAQLVGTCSRSVAKHPGVKPSVYTSAPDFRQWLYDTARGGPRA